MFPVALLLTVLAASCSALEVSTYNLFLFGSMSAATDTKSRDTSADPQALVIEQSDITAIQGGKSLESVQTAFMELQEKNSYWKILDLGPKERGPHHAHEYVGFIYRSDRVSLDQLRIVWDPKENFETTPFSVLVKPLADDVRPFVMAIVYLSESHTLDELDNLPKLYKDLKKDYNNQNVLIGGEFHTGCDYLSDEEFNEATVTTSKKFEWLSLPTNGTGTPRGRFLAAGRDLLHDITAKGCHTLAVPYLVHDEAVAVTLDGTAGATS